MTPDGCICKYCSSLQRGIISKANVWECPPRVKFSVILLIPFLRGDLAYLLSEMVFFPPVGVWIPAPGGIFIAISGLRWKQNFLPVSCVSGMPTQAQVMVYTSPVYTVPYNLWRGVSGVDIVGGDSGCYVHCDRHCILTVSLGVKGSVDYLWIGTQCWNGKCSGIVQDSGGRIRLLTALCQTLQFDLSDQANPRSRALFWGAWQPYNLRKCYPYHDLHWYEVTRIFIN